MNIVSVAGTAVVICLLAVTVRQVKPEFSVGMLLLGGCAIAAVCIGFIAPTVSELNELSSKYALSGGFALVLKAVGICFITQTAADTCRDAACGSLATKVEAAGKIAVLAVIFPLFKSLLETAVEIIN